MEYPLLPKQMPQRIKAVWRKNHYVTMGIFFLLGVAGTVALVWFDQFKGIFSWFVIAYFVILGLIFALVMALIPYRYTFHRYEITTEDIAFQKGFIFRSITYVPLNRIQHVETEQGPFLRQENLMEIVIHTAATSHHLAGLDMQEAMALRQQIIELVKAAKEDV
ncbi:PH domain-containing protein [Enterococcus xiangfangensis]|uniref:PH domain-containing protein n=1 Tax=Enterococcus xiangfangensis TaxID=1296537 RepID=UPI003D178066|nr:hypothetical protein [Enterococcus asini]